MKTSTIALLFLMLVLLSGCSSPTATPTIILPKPTQSPAATATVSSTPSPEPTSTQTPLPTPTPTRRPPLASLLDPAATPQNDDPHLLVFSYFEDNDWYADGEVFVMNLDGTGRKNITNNPAYDGWHPEWSPDGRKLAFLSSRDGNYCLGIPGPDCIMDLYTINLDGSGLRRITHGLMSRDYAWSSDGSMMAYGHFSLNTQGNEYFGDIFLVNLHSLEVVNLTNHPKDEARYFFDYDIDWSPDGRRLVFASNYQDGIYVIDMESKETKFWTEGEGYYGNPQWSPDGSRIVFIHWDSIELGRPGQATLHPQQIILVDADLSNSHLLIEEESLEAYPQWSPDGTWIAYGSGSIFHYVTIKAIDMETITAHTLLDVQGADGTSMVWTPDSQHLIFSAQLSERSNSDLYQINLDGSGLIQLTQTGGIECCFSIQP